MDLEKICEERNYLKKSQKLITCEDYCYTVAQMAEMLQLSEKTVRKIIVERNVPVIKGSKKIRVLRDTFEKYMAT